MTPAETLRAAAARVRQGWCQFTADDHAGNVCALGALIGVDNFGYYPAYFALAQSVNGAVSDWNDARGQTAEGVAAGLERAADVWELEQTPPVQWTHREHVSQEVA